MRARQGRAETGNGFLREERSQSLAWCQGGVGVDSGGDEAVCEAAVGESHAYGGEPPAWL
jgi:hypothetical protein